MTNAWLINFCTVRIPDLPMIPRSAMKTPTARTAPNHREIIVIEKLITSKVAVGFARIAPAKNSPESTA